MSSLSDLQITSQLDDSINRAYAQLDAIHAAVAHYGPNDLFDPTQPLTKEDEAFQNEWRQHLIKTEQRIAYRESKRNDGGPAWLAQHKGSVSRSISKRKEHYGPDHPRTRSAQIKKALYNSRTQLRRYQQSDPTKAAYYQQRIDNLLQQREAVYAEIRRNADYRRHQTGAQLPKPPVKPDYIAPPIECPDVGLDED